MKDEKKEKRLGSSSFRVITADKLDRRDRISIEIFPGAVVIKSRLMRSALISNQLARSRNSLCRSTLLHDREHLLTNTSSSSSLLSLSEGR